MVLNTLEAFNSFLIIVVCCKESMNQKRSPRCGITDTTTKSVSILLSTFRGLLGGKRCNHDDGGDHNTTRSSATCLNHVSQHETHLSELLRRSRSCRFLIQTSSSSRLETSRSFIFFSQPNSLIIRRTLIADKASTWLCYCECMVRLRMSWTYSL